MDLELKTYHTISLMEAIADSGCYLSLLTLYKKGNLHYQKIIEALAYRMREDSEIYNSYKTALAVNGIELSQKAPPFDYEKARQEGRQYHFDLLFDNITLELYDTSNILYKLYSDTSSKYYQEKLFNENFDSIGIYINVNDHHIFLGGDMTCSNTEVDELKKRSINAVNEIYKKHNISQIDIYKSCHHGGGGIAVQQAYPHHPRPNSNGPRIFAIKK